MTCAIDELCALVAEAGGVMRLHGRPVGATGLRAHAAVEVDRKVDRAVEVAQWRAVWADELRGGR